jgi:hypothetical protein
MVAACALSNACLFFRGGDLLGWPQRGSLKDGIPTLPGPARGELRLMVVARAIVDSYR